MQKILSIPQIREADEHTIRLEPVTSLDLMERAAAACFIWIRERLEKRHRILLFCGTGNNGGDGLVIARLLTEAECKAEVFICPCSGSESPDFRANLLRCEELQIPVNYLESIQEVPEIQSEDIVIDALFGSGLNRDLTGLPAELVRYINSRAAIVISIDIPSGMRGDTASTGPLIRADYTLSFEVPKLAFFFPENEYFLGEWHIIPIGLLPQYIQDVPVSQYLIDESDIRSLLEPRKRFDHKGTFGHGLLIAGSHGKAGAAVLASRAALRSGAGLITAHTASSACTILQTAIPEAMISPDPSFEFVSELPDLSTYRAIACGPGIGTSEETARILKQLIQQSAVPIILDADALNILAANPTWLSFLPPNSILTPHLKEFERLAGKTSTWEERHETQRQFSIKYGLILILKGAFSCISFPDGSCYFNPTGNPGMATGGSGDVLTGILLGLLTRGYSPAKTCLTGVYLHGLAGDLAAGNMGMESLIAGDIIDHLPKAFEHLTRDIA